MAPTLRPGDQITYVKGAPERGSIVVYRLPGSWIESATGHDEALSRVIAVGGDRVECHGGLFTVNGQRLPAYYRFRKLGCNVPSGFDVTVPAGRVFLVDDNRADFDDSRGNLTGFDHGTVSDKNIVGVINGELFGSFN